MTQDQALAKAMEDGVKSIIMLRVARFCHRPRRYSEIENTLGVDYCTIGRHIRRGGGMIEKIPEPVREREQGAHPVLIRLTPLGQRIVERVFGIKTTREVSGLPTGG